MKRFLCLLFLAFVSQAQAAVRFEAEQWYGIEYHITISGEIEAGDSDKFKQLILAQLRASHLISQFNIYSSGGNVDEAFKMGEQIRALAVPTNAPELLDNKPRCTMGSLDAQTTRVGGSCDCQSACFLLWVAGIGRSGTYIGIHRPHYLNGPTRQKEFVEQYGELMSKTKDYFRKLNLPDWVFPRLYSVASQDMLLLPLNYFQDLQNNRIDLEEYILQKCGKEPGGTLYTSKERKAYIECKMPAIDTALAEGASKYLSLYGNPSEVFIPAPPSQPSPSVRQSFLLVAPPPNPMIAPPQPAAPPEVPDKPDCAKMTGDDVIVDVRYGDPDGGLVVRAEPRVSGDRLGIIP